MNELVMRADSLTLFRAIPRTSTSFQKFSSSVGNLPGRFITVNNRCARGQ